MLGRTLFIIQLLLLALQRFQSLQRLPPEGRCVFGSGHCGALLAANGVSRSIPCLFDGPPRVLNDTDLLQRFDKVCPSLDVLRNQGDGLCCDEDQINIFITSVQKAKDILGSCPSCFINLSHLFCDLTCNPRQASFATVTESSKYRKPISKEGAYVRKINYSIDQKFVDGLFNSCKDVVWNQAQTKALNVLCGDQCTPTEFVEFLGEEWLAPFKIHYQHTSISRVEPITCNSSVGETYPRLKGFYPSRCSLNDCPGELQPVQQPPESRIVEILSINELASLGFMLMVALVCLIYDHLCDYDHFLIDSTLNQMFRRWALFCVQHATRVILFGLAGVTLSCVGLTKLQLITDPFSLWTQPGSQANQERAYFEQTFEPYYRVEQVVVYPANGSQPWIPHNGDANKTFSSVFQLDFLLSVLRLQKEIEQLKTVYDDELVGLTDICAQTKSNNICSVQSPLGWFQGEEKNFELGLTGDKPPEYLAHFMACLKNSRNTQDEDYHQLSCLGLFGGPILPHIGLAGYPGNSYWRANSLVISIPLKNNYSIEETRKARAWEQKFIKFLSNYQDPKLTLAFYSERSFEDEIERQSQPNTINIVIAYLVMFAYASMSLGRTSDLGSFLHKSPVVSILGGLLIALASVLASIGLLSFFGVRSTFITIEVLPFLMLAIGVDNTFIIVQALKRSFRTDCPSNSNSEERISNVVGELASSLSLGLLARSSCFLIGSLTPMPAVRVFAMTAFLALVVAFVLQMTVFISLLALDTVRQSSSSLGDPRVLQSKRSRQPSLISSQEVESALSLPKLHLGDTGDSIITLMTKPGIDKCPPESGAEIMLPETDRDPLNSLFENVVAPNLMKPSVRTIALIVYVGWLILSLAVIHKIDVGLDQTMSVPEDSHMQDYFHAPKADLRVGPPVFFVLKRGLDFSNETERNAVCASAGCHSSSLVSHITQASRTPATSYIATPPTSWIDDYKAWGSNDKCCRVFNYQNNTLHLNHTIMVVPTNPAACEPLANQVFMSHKKDLFCSLIRLSSNGNIRCEYCGLINEEHNEFNPDRFYDYVEDFLHNNPRMICVSGGSDVYSNLVKVRRNDTADHSKVLIDSAFSTHHSALRDSKDFIESMKSARLIAQNIEDMLNVNLPTREEKLEVFPYCSTYVFYEQYLTIWQQTVRNLSMSIATVFAVTYLLLGCDLYISTVVVCTVASIVIDLMGLMYFWHIQLNAISLVNLVVAVGISVDFCSHIARAFALSSKEKPTDRAQDALVEMGSSVLSGITLTKVVGMSMLAFAKSRMFKVHYFRMYMGMVLVGALHGIVFMPIALSLTAKERAIPAGRESDQEKPQHDDTKHVEHN